MANSGAQPTPNPGQTACPDALEMAMQQSTYGPQSTQLKATLSNGTRHVYTFGEASYLQRKSDGAWEDVPFQEDVAWIMIAYVLEPGESQEVTLPLNLFGALEPGPYRLVKDVSYETDGKTVEQKVWAQFCMEDGMDVSGLKLTMRQSAYSPDSAQLGATLKNETQYICTFGEASSLQRKSGGAWEDVPFQEDVAWIEIAHVLHPGESREITLPLNLFDTLEPGDYRLVKDTYCDRGDGQGMQARVTAQFAIKH